MNDFPAVPHTFNAG